MSEELKPCPQCKETPEIGYACGEYFIFSRSKCLGECICSSFNEMHGNREQEIEAWNRRIDNMAKCKEYCKDCIHNNICDLQKVIIENRDSCEHFKDRNRFVELPCKVGDTIYEIKERRIKGELKWKKVIVERVVHSIDIGLNNCMTVISGTTITLFLSDLGKTLFLTMEEAERALNYPAKSDS